MATAVPRERERYGAKIEGGRHGELVFLLGVLSAKDEISGLGRVKERRCLGHVVYKGRLTLSRVNIAKAQEGGRICGLQPA